MIDVVPFFTGLQVPTSMRRVILQLVSLSLILALSAGALALAGLDTKGGSSHELHMSAEADHSACVHTTHTDSDDCWTPCPGANHCLAGAANFAGALPVTAVNHPPMAWPGQLPPPPYYLHERPPRTT